MESLSKWDLEHWWKLVAAAGALIAIASVSVKLAPALLVGLGLLLFGAGEWSNHKEGEEKKTVEGVSGFRIVTVYSWKPNAFGLTLDFLGVVLFAIGILRVLSL